MEDCSFQPFNDQLHKQFSGIKDERLTISVSEQDIELLDHHDGSVKVYPHNAGRNFTLEPGTGNDIIHVVSKGDLNSPVSVNIEPKDGHKLIVGSPDPRLKLHVQHPGNGDLVIPDDSPVTYERYAGKIRQWNERNRKKDGILKSIKRKLVYLFGRDLRFRRPFLIEKKIMDWLSRINFFKAAAYPTGISYFTTREHLDKLEQIARPGDILLRYQDGYPFDKYFVGTWQHAGLYLKKGHVIDAMGNGTYLRTMDEFGEADGIVLVRIENMTDRQIQLALSYAFEQIGKSYSVDFDDNSTEQYCSGLVINACKYCGVLKAGYRQYESIHPDDLLTLPNSRILWTNRPDLVNKSLPGCAVS